MRHRSSVLTRQIYRRCFSSTSDKGLSTPSSATFQTQAPSSFATAISPKPAGHTLLSERLASTCLSEPVDDLPHLVYADEDHIDKNEFLVNTKLTKLPSGLRVATAEHLGDYCTIGAFIDAGSRHERLYPPGIVHFLEKLAFSGTESHADRSTIYSELEKHSSIIDGQTSKDLCIYAASCHRAGLEPVLEILSDAVIRPSITNEEIENIRKIVTHEWEVNMRSPKPDILLADWIHAAAYKDNTLGLPKLTPNETVSHINKEMLYSFMSTYFVPERTVVVGVGVDHDRMIAAAEKYLINCKPVWESKPGLLLPSIPPVDASVAQYTGGEVRISKDLSKQALGPSPYPELAHFVLGLESSSYLDEDFTTFCVLASLMGGGGSFSAGGPGKGMYSVLYTDLLNRYHWVHTATSSNHVYIDSGIFCIHTACPPKEMSTMVSLVIQQFLNLTKSIEKEAFERAKTQLVSNLLMNLELRPVIFEDVGRQIIGHGHRQSAVEVIEKIRNVSLEDINRVAERMLASKASVVGYGTLDGLHNYEKIDQALVHRDTSRLKSSFFSFSK